MVAIMVLAGMIYKSKLDGNKFTKKEFKKWYKEFIPEVENKKIDKDYSGIMQLFYENYKETGATITVAVIIGKLTQYLKNKVNQTINEDEKTDEKNVKPGQHELLNSFDTSNLTDNITVIGSHPNDDISSQLFTERYGHQFCKDELFDLFKSEPPQLGQ